MGSCEFEDSPVQKFGTKGNVKRTGLKTRRYLAELAGFDAFLAGFVEEGVDLGLQI